MKEAKTGHQLHYNLKVLTGILLILLLNMLLQGFFTWRSISDEQQNRMRMEANVQNDKVDELKKNVERIVTNSIPAFEQQLDHPEEVDKLLLALLQNNRQLLGSSVAFVPGYFAEKSRLYAPYAYRENGTIRIKVLVYDYTTFEWYKNGMNNKKGSWTAPYADGDATFALMTTFSVPLYDSEHRQVAVLTGDLPMNQLTTVDNTPYHRISMRTLAILGMQVLSVLLILLIAYRAFRDRRKMEKARREKEQTEYEMSIAQQIQTGFQPSELPKHDHLLVSGSMELAEQVSGDFYDCSLHGDTLSFCVGDISTKGLGAAMAMVVTWTAYRAYKRKEASQASVLSQMNRMLTEINEQQMFATFFAGELDLRTGLLTYCNAAHLTPVVLTAEGETRLLDAKPNVPLGIDDWNFEQQTLQLQPGDTLFFYTDGIIEAMNEQEGVFGEKRLMLHLKSAAEGRERPEGIVKRINSALHHHIGLDRKPNDDMTMLAIQYC